MPSHPSGTPGAAGGKFPAHSGKYTGRKKRRGKRS